MSGTSHLSVSPSITGTAAGRAAVRPHTENVHNPPVGEPRRGLQVTKAARSMIRIASVCLAIYWLAIFTATHIPKGGLPALHWSDKTYHAIAFFGLSFLLAWALPTREGRALPTALLAAVIALVYAGFDEFTQNFIPGRTADLYDFFADACGIALGLSCYLVCRSLLVQFRWGKNLIQTLSR